MGRVENVFANGGYWQAHRQPNLSLRSVLSWFIAISWLNVSVCQDYSVDKKCLATGRRHWAEIETAIEPIE
jgi:hypothetical protein